MKSALLEALASELSPIMDRQKAMRYGVKHDAGAGTPSGNQYSHGPGGMLTFPGVDPVIFNAAMGAVSLINELPTMPSLYTNPTYWTLTGVRDVTGSEKDGVCDDAPVAGLLKGCLTTSVFGRYERATPLLEVNRLGQRTDRADPLDLRLVGSPLGEMNGPFSPNMNMNAPGDLLVNEISRKFWERNVAFYRLLARQIWTGNPANNSAGGGYKELTGLDLLINTGYVDAETGVACPAQDSYVSDFNHARIDTNGTNTVAAIVDMYHQVQFRAQSMGLMPVRWLLAMRSQMFYQLAAVWPCAYYTVNCTPQPGGSVQSVVQVNAADQVQLRDEMRAGKFLLIDGERVDVVLDDGIAELDGNNGGGNFPKGCFESTIYLIPMSVVGGQSVCFMEYFQYQNPSIQEALGNMVLGRIEGAFLTWPRQRNMCIEWQSKIEPRMVLRTPWLAARLDNVVYCPVQHVRESFPDEPYFVNGGRSYRDGPSYYSLWQSRQ